MQKLMPNDPESTSLNGLTQNLTRLHALFPEAFTEGRLNFDTLRELLADQIDDQPEKYGLNWNGKARARRHALTPTRATLRPDKDSSVNWDTTQNLMIEGDNLEVLKLLQRSYAGTVKLIYIDPPYNTGKDFVYPDNYTDSLRNYQEITGQTEDGRRVSTNAEGGGRFHTDWLNMMYPRLKLARELLREDGVIFVSVDDVEISNINAMLTEIFGEENYVTNLVWDRNRKNDAKFFSVGHEYMAVYFKNKQNVIDSGAVYRGKKPGVEEVRDLFDKARKKYGEDYEKIREDISEYYSKILEGDERWPLKRYTKVDSKGPYRDDGNINWPGGNGPRYAILHPITQAPVKLPTSGWRYPNPERFWEI